MPEMLRLAPNLQVDQPSASDYVDHRAGLQRQRATQNFSNKLLVLIDGRSVYTPLYSGVYWDMQDVLPEDIDRIEVISGPGATLWGANAVNGVINIITRKASDTQGGLIDLGAGNLEQSVAAAHMAARLDDDLTYRVYAKDYFGDDTDTAHGANAHDHWSQAAGRLPPRLDAGRIRQRDPCRATILHGSEAQPGAPDQDISRPQPDRPLDTPFRRRLVAADSQPITIAKRARQKTTAAISGSTLTISKRSTTSRRAAGTPSSGAAALRISDYNIHGTASLLFAPDEPRPRSRRYLRTGRDHHRSFADGDTRP